MKLDIPSFSKESKEDTKDIITFDVDGITFTFEGKGIIKPPGYLLRVEAVEKLTPLERVMCRDTITAMGDQIKDDVFIL